MSVKIGYSVFPALHDEYYTPIAQKWLESSPVELVTDRQKIGKARGILADVLFIFHDQLKKSEICLLYLFDRKESSGAWSSSDGLYSHNVNEDTGESYAVIGLNVEAIVDTTEEYVVTLLLHELSHAPQSEGLYTPSGGVLPHDNVFSTIEEAYLASYYLQTGQWLTDAPYL